MIAKLFKWQSSGFKDWIWQRVSAITFLAYLILVIGFWFLYPLATHLQWHDFLLSLQMRILGTIALFSFLLHAWLGLWTVITDYIKPASLSKFFTYMVIFIIFQYSVAGLFLLWRL